MALDLHHPTQLMRFPEHEDLLVEQPVYRKGPAAPAPARVGAGEDEESCLGSVPHTLRGSLHAFTQVDQTRVDQLNLSQNPQVAPTGPAFSQCTACSPPVLKALKEEGWELVKKVGERPSYLEDLTGLTALMQVGVCNGSCERKRSIF